MPIARIGGTVLGIAGMGIGIGLLAHTARGVARMTDEMYDSRRREIRETPRRAMKARVPRRGIKGRPKGREFTRTVPQVRKPAMYNNYWGLQKYW